MATFFIVSKRNIRVGLNVSLCFVWEQLGRDVCWPENTMRLQPALQWREGRKADATTKLIEPKEGAPLQQVIKTSQRPAERIVRHHAGEATFGGQGDDGAIFGDSCAEILGINHLTYPAQVKAIGIKAGLHRQVIVAAGRSMQAAGGRR